MIADLDSHLHRLFARDDWSRFLLLGSLLAFTAGNVVSAVLLSGYATRLARSVRDDASRPAFTDLPSLVRDGVRAVAVVAAYHVPALAAFAATAFAVRSRAVVAPELLAAVAGPGTLTLGTLGRAAGGAPAVALGLAVSAALALAAGYLSAAAFVRFVRGGTVGDGLNLAAVWSLARTRGFLRTWLVGVTVLFVTRIAAGFLSVVPVVGPLLAAATTFVAGSLVVELVADRSPVASGRGVDERDAGPVTVA
jgi:hypothetical protein